MIADKTLWIQIRDAYGIARAYPQCDVSNTFARLSRSKTLTLHTLESVLALGYVIKELSRSGKPSDHHLTLESLQNAGLNYYAD